MGYHGVGLAAMRAKTRTLCVCFLTYLDVGVAIKLGKLYRLQAVEVARCQDTSVHACVCLLTSPSPLSVPLSLSLCIYLSLCLSLPLSLPPPPSPHPCLSSLPLVFASLSIPPPPPPRPPRPPPCSPPGRPGRFPHASCCQETWHRSRLNFQTDNT